MVAIKQQRVTKSFRVMKKFILFVNSLFLLLIFSLPVYADTFSATVTKITDGDTIWVIAHGKKIKLRLLGIDTPEEYPSRKMSRDIRRCHTSYEKMKRLGLLATKHAKTMLWVGEKVTVETFGKGYYHRTLAFVILPDGTNYNEKEVADGYACVYKYHGHKSREISWSEFSKLERLMEKAKKEKKGLWGKYYKIMDCLCE